MKYVTIKKNGNVCVHVSSCSCNADVKYLYILYFGIQYSLEGPLWMF